MYNILMVIANHDFQDLEFSNPYQLFLDKEYTVDICSGKGGECFGVFTTYIEDSLSFDEVNPDNYDVIVFVGGGGAYSEYHDNEAYQALAKQSLSSPNGETRILGAICIAPSLLASIGLFEGKEVTGRDDGKGTEIAILEES
jgi:protease I